MPFDFSDQYIGCIKVNAVDNDLLNVQYGFTEAIRRVDISPSDVDRFKISDEDFEEDSPKATLVSVMDFKNSVIESINDLLKVDAK